MATRMQQRRGLASEWAAANPVLADGEIGVVRDTKLIKVGDGVTTWNSLPAAFNAEYLPLLGKADDADKLDGLDSTAYVKTADAVSAATASKVAARDGSGNTSFNEVILTTESTSSSATRKSYVDGLTSPTSATRQLVNYWGAVSSFPTTGVRIGDTCIRTDLGTNGSIWMYAGAGMGVTGWVHKGLLVCTLATRPGVTYDGLEIYETDTKLIWVHNGTTWITNNFPFGQARQTVASPAQTASAWATMLLQTVDIDTHTGFNANGRYTVPAGQAGTYMVSGKLQLGGAVTCNSRIIKNGTTFATSTGEQQNSANSSLTGAKMLQLAVGDYLEIQGFCTVAGWGTAVSADGTTFMNVHRVR